VSLNLMTQADVEAAYAVASRKGGSKSVIVERFVTGDEHRLLVVGKQLVAAARGESLWVTGDGASNIIELCNRDINIDPRRGETEDHPLGLIKPDVSAEIILELKRQGMTAESVPQAGQKVLIQPNGNVSIDVTDQVHPSVAYAAALAARVVGLDIAGIDIVVDDISRPLEEQGGAIIEVNASPGLLAHLKPAVGKPREIGSAIVGNLFGPDESGRIPIVGVTGKRDTALIARMVGCMLRLTGVHTGVVNANGLYLDERKVSSANSMNFDAGERLLINRTVQAAVFESDARMILAEGLAYDRCTVGIVTDMDGLDTLGEYHIEDMDALANVIRAQVDVVMPDGAAVLNAAVTEVADLARLSDGEVIFYAEDHALATIAEHRAEGNRAVFLRDGGIVLAEGGDETALLAMSALTPATAAFPGAVLAAVAATWALGMEPGLIAAGLRTFDASPARH
jgi:cyanophycin synthetase